MSDETKSPAAAVPPVKADPVNSKPAVAHSGGAKPRVWFKDPTTGVRKEVGGK